MTKINTGRRSYARQRRATKRVAHLTSVHPPFDPRIFHKQCKTLHDAGFDVHLVAQHTQSETVDGIAISALSEVSGRYARIALQAPLYRQAYALQADVYHIHDPELIPLLWLLKQTTGASVIYDMHEDYASRAGLEGRLLRALERWCFRWIDHVVYANAVHRRIVASLAPATRIANYVQPTEQHKKLHQRPDPPPFTLLYTGVMSNQGGRGLSNLIDLACALRDASHRWALRLVGVCYVPSDRQQIERRIRREKLGPYIEQIGWSTYVPWQRMQPHYVQSHVGLVLGTDHRNTTEKIPTKFYEYISYGLPIICSDFPLWQSFIERHGCGVAVPPGDAEAVVSVLQHWMDDPAQYQAYAKRAREAADQFQWGGMGDRLVTLYKKMIA